MIDILAPVELSVVECKFSMPKLRWLLLVAATGRNPVDTFFGANVQSAAYGGIGDGVLNHSLACFQAQQRRQPIGVTSLTMIAKLRLSLSVG